MIKIALIILKGKKNKNEESIVVLYKQKNINNLAFHTAGPIAPEVSSQQTNEHNAQKSHQTDETAKLFRFYKGFLFQQNFADVA